MAVNGVPIKKASELFGIVNVIFFSPEDLNIIKNGPAERRRFLDLELCQLNKVYVYDLVQYNRVVVQRNKLLKEMDSDPSLKETLNIWDSQLVRFGSELIRLRTRFVEELNELIREIHFHLSGEREELEIRYEPNVTPETFEAELSRNRNQELRQRLTLTGPHRDDLEFYCQWRRYPEIWFPGPAEDGGPVLKAFGDRAGEKDREGLSGSASGRRAV